MTLLGVDIGTTGCKAAVVSPPDGAPAATAYREYRLEAQWPGRAELDPDVVWAGVCEVVREASASAVRSGLGPPRALSFACLGEAVTPIDSAGRALTRSIVSFDARSVAHYRRLMETLGTERITELTGQRPQPHYSVAKWQWLAVEAPDVCTAARWLVGYGGLAAARLGLEPVIDHTMAARTMAFNPATGNWVPEILEAAGVDAAKLPALVPSGAVVGEIPPSVCSDLSLAGGALLVAGGLDQACAAFGAGTTSGDPALLSLGTVAVLAKAIPPGTPAGMIPTVPYFRDGSLAVAGTPAGGAVLRWYRDTFGHRHSSSPRQGRVAWADSAGSDGHGSEAYDAIVGMAAGVETDVTAIPHFAGSRTAFDSPHAAAVLCGLTFATGEGDIVRALLEGVAMETAVMAEKMGEEYGRVESLRAVGGGSRSDIWMQIFADVLGVGVESTASGDAAAVGAALLAGLGSGADIDGVRTPVKSEYRPDAASVARYRGKLERFRALVDSLAETGPPQGESNSQPGVGG